MAKYFDTPGERIIEFFLQDEGIKYRKQEKIPHLAGDYADYRVADFYLPQYKVYIEFQGEWNNEAAKEKYRKKKEIYEKNRIPCIPLFPDNLGILKYIFYIRLNEEFEKYHDQLKIERIKYRISTSLKLLTYIWFSFLVACIGIILMTNLLLTLVVTPFATLLIFLALLMTIGLTIYVIKRAVSYQK